MQLYGPFCVREYVEDVLTDHPAAGLHYTTDAATFAENEAVLNPYRVYPSHPLQFIMAGDGLNGTYDNTVPLCFPDQESVDNLGATISQLVMMPES